MKIAILGGGITGLTAGYYLSKKGHQVTIMEKGEVLGGLAAGFKQKEWDWYLERAYHHLFASDSDILNFAKEIGYKKIYFNKPVTSSLFLVGDKLSAFPLDTPIDLLIFPLLGLIDKLRAGIIILFLKLSPFLSVYKTMTSEEFLKKTMGIKVWNVLWQQLFRGKFGKYAGIISLFYLGQDQ
jgi:protoporphyrinogen oxidase